jgi:hypothetical protein
MDSYTVLRVYIDVLQKWCSEHPDSDCTISTSEFSISPLLAEVLKRVESQKYIFITNDGQCQAVDSQDANNVPESFKNKRYMKASTRSNIRDVIKVLFQLLNIHEKDHTITVAEFVSLCQFALSLQTENDDLSQASQEFYKYIRKQFFHIPSFYHDKKVWQKKYRDPALQAFFGASKNIEALAKSLAACEQKADDLSHHFDTQLTTFLSLKQSNINQQGAVSNLNEVVTSLNNDFHSLQQVCNEQKEKLDSLVLALQANTEKDQEFKRDVQHSMNEIEARTLRLVDHTINDLETRLKRMIDSSSKPVLSEIQSAVAEIKHAVEEIKVAEEEVKHAVEEVRSIDKDAQNEEQAEHQEQEKHQEESDSESEYETDSDSEEVKIAAEPVKEEIVEKVEEVVQAIIEETVEQVVIKDVEEVKPVEEVKEDVVMEEAEPVVEEKKEEVVAEAEPVVEEKKEEVIEEVAVEETKQEEAPVEEVAIVEESKVEEPTEEELPELCEPEPIPEICEPEEPEVSEAVEEKPLIMKQVSIAIKGDQNAEDEEDLEITRLGKFFVIKGTRVAVNLDDGNAIGFIDANGELHKEESEEVKQACETYHIGFN